MRKYFGTDGIRRIANTELTPELVYKVAKAGAYVFKKDKNLAAAKFMGSQLRGYPRSSDSSISSMVLTMNEDGSVSFKAELEKYTVTYITDISISTVYEGSFVSMGESVQDIQTINKEENKDKHRRL